MDGQNRSAAVCLENMPREFMMKTLSNWQDVILCLSPMLGTDVQVLLFWRLGYVPQLCGNFHGGCAVEWVICFLLPSAYLGRSRIFAASFLAVVSDFLRWSSILRMAQGAALPALGESSTY